MHNGLVISSTPLYVDTDIDKSNNKFSDEMIDKFTPLVYHISRGNNMDDIRSAIEKTVSISKFNKGLAGQIFEEVRRTGAKVVIKNNVPECVLLSPEEYINLIDQLEDAQDLIMALDRMSNFDPKNTISQEELYRKLGVTAEDIENMEDVELG